METPMEQTVKSIAELVSKVEAIGEDGLNRILDVLEEAAHPDARRPESFARANEISRTTVYDEIKSRRLETFKVGACRLISREAGERWRRRLEEETAQAEAA